MDLNKKLEELKPYQLNCNVFDVYSYNGLSMQDLLCQFFTKINECITVSNETIDLADWLVNEGLEIEVVKKLMIWLEDGTLENIINVNLFNTLNEKINGLSSQLEQFMYSRFKGKKIVFLGDSITVGFVDKPFANLVAENMGMTLVNLAVSGSHVTYENDEVVKSIFVQRGDIPTDADLICIAGGTNDFGHNKPIGISSSDNFYDFYGAYKIMIDWIQENRPNATLFCMTPLHREGDQTENTLGYVLEDYVNVIRDVCEDRGVPVLDLFSRGELNPNISSHKSLFATDGLHPNQIIHDRLGNHIIPNFIRGL